MIFEIFNRGDGTCETQPYDPGGDMFLILLEVGCMLVSGLLTYQYLSFPYFAAALFVSLLLLFPFPQARYGHPLIAIPFLYYSVGSIIYTGFKTGLLLGCIPLCVIVILIILSIGATSDASTYYAVFSIVNAAGMFLFLCCMAFHYLAEKSCINEFLYGTVWVGVAGILTSLFPLLVAIIKDRRLRGSVVVCLAMLLTGFVPVAFSYLLFQNSANVAFGSIVVTILAAACYVGIGCLNRFLTRFFDAYEISTCLPALIPALMATALPMLYHQRLDDLVDFEVTRKIVSFVQESKLGGRFETLTYCFGLPRGVGALIRLFLFAVILIISNGAVTVIKRNKRWRNHSK